MWVAGVDGRAWWPGGAEVWWVAGWGEEADGGEAEACMGVLWKRGWGKGRWVGSWVRWQSGLQGTELHSCALAGPIPSCWHPSCGLLLEKWSGRGTWYAAPRALCRTVPIVLFVLSLSVFFAFFSIFVIVQENSSSKPAIAQLAEHLTVDSCSNQMVPGSIPGGRTCALPQLHTGLQLSRM